MLQTTSSIFWHAAAATLLSPARYLYAPYPTAPPPVKPVLPPTAPPTATPHPAPRAAPKGILSPKVKSAGTIPIAAPRAPPVTNPVATPPAPTTQPPLTADATATWTPVSDANSFAPLAAMQALLDAYTIALRRAFEQLLTMVVANATAFTFTLPTTSSTFWHVAAATLLSPA